MNAGLRRWAPLLIVVVLLGLATIAAVLSTAQVTHVPLALQPHPTSRATAQPGASATAPSAAASASASVFSVPIGELHLPDWVIYLVVALWALIIASFIGSLAWQAFMWWWRRPSVQAVPMGGSATAEQRHLEMQAAVAQGLAELDADDDPRQAVIACWVRLERAADAAGVPRLVGDTSTDLVRRMLETHKVSRDVLAGFADVYRIARYGTGPVDEQMREHARSALRQVRDELGGRGRMAKAGQGAAAEIAPGTAAGAGREVPG